MSNIINKKLHPYYKTGIYGWFGEEVDDNDYIICPICGEVLGMNYCDYAGEQGYNNQCPKCKQELDYSEIYDFEDTLYFRQLLEIKESKLADLEAKLVESEKSKESYRLQNDDHQLKLLQFYSRLGVEAFGVDIHEKALEEFGKLKQKLEKATELVDCVDKLKQFGADIEEYALVNYKEADKIFCENEELKQQLAEKEKEMEIYRRSMEVWVEKCENHNQDKISFAVEKLKQVKNDISSGLAFDVDVQEWFEEYIDNQIKQLKEGK